MSLILKTICSYIPRLMDFINCLLYHYFLPVLLYFLFFLGDVCSLHQMFMGFFFSISVIFYGGNRQYCA